MVDWDEGGVFSCSSSLGSIVRWGLGVWLSGGLLDRSAVDRPGLAPIAFALGCEEALNVGLRIGLNILDFGGGMSSTLNASPMLSTPSF